MFFSKEKIEKFDTIRFNFLIVKKFDNHLEVTLNRPQKKNALSFEMINELAICTDYANLHDSVRAVVYKSNGEIFCSGLDLIDFKDKENSIQLADVFNKLYKPKMVILEGDVYAGGVLIVACANYVISKNNVKLSLPEVERGLYPFQVMDSLFRSMSKKSVIDWCINGKEMTAEECKKLNLIDEVCDNNLMDLCQNWIDQTLSMSPNAIRTGLRVYDELYIDNDKIDKLNNELDELKKSDDFTEGIKAFKEKRKPKWK